jgi:hypothetical protein
MRFYLTQALRRPGPGPSGLRTPVRSPPAPDLARGRGAGAVATVPNPGSIKVC